MSRKKSVLICTCNNDMCQLLKLRFLESGYFSVIDSTSDGERALMSTKQLYPDLLILDYEMKRPDINSMFSRIEEISEYCRPQIFLLIPYTRNLSAKELSCFSFKKCFTYPCDYDTIVENGIDVFSKAGESFKMNFEKKAALLLQKESIPKHLSGYKYLMEASFIVASSPQQYHGAYELYAEVAKTYKTKVSNVERNIRTALTQGYVGEKKPTNLAFIYYIANKILYEL